MWHGLAGVNMESKGIKGVPDFSCIEFAEKTKDYALLIPVINEGERILRELNRGKNAGIAEWADIVICDGGSTDGSMKEEVLRDLNVNTLLIKRSAGRQGAQLRMGMWWALNRGYKGIITIDGNDKDSIEDVPSFIRKLENGFDFVQGSRFIAGGREANTPLLRRISVKLIHAPVISLTAGERFTDTTNAFRGYSAEYLSDPRVQPFRDVFDSYELLAYLSVRASQLGMKTCEIPVGRFYPSTGKTPTKISAVQGSFELMKILLLNAAGYYRPDMQG